MWVTTQSRRKKISMHGSRSAFNSRWVHPISLIQMILMAVRKSQRAMMLFLSLLTRTNVGGNIYGKLLICCFLKFFSCWITCLLSQEHFLQIPECWIIIRIIWLWLFVLSLHISLVVILKMFYSTEKEGPIWGLEDTIIMIIRYLV